MKRKYVKVWLLCLLLGIISGCGRTTETALIEDTKNIEIENNELLYITRNDYKTEFTNPTYINLDTEEEGLTIEEGGEYVLKGKYNRTITIDTHDELVHLFLDNVSLQTAIGPAINVVSASKVIITLMEDSVSTVFDAAFYSDTELKGAISSAADLTINGNGSLYICGYYKDAIYTKDVFKLIGGTVQVKAKRYGIKGMDGIVLAPETLVIESEKDGCQTANHGKSGKGIIDIREGEINIVSGEYGLSAVSDVYIRGGELYINSIIADIYTEGQQYIGEGVVWNE